MVADNDLALGRIVEAISKSKSWNDSAIFVVEDDAQNGPDHVDAHRSPALSISPFSKRRSVDGTLYTTCSILRTIELILGLPPMSQFDASATPLYGAFQALKWSVSGVAKDTPVSERREFEQLPMKTTAGRRDECGSYDKIAAAIKRQSPWLSQPGGERRLHCRRRILGD